MGDSVCTEAATTLLVRTRGTLVSLSKFSSDHDDAGHSSNCFECSILFEIQRVDLIGNVFILVTLVELIAGEGATRFSCAPNSWSGKQRVGLVDDVFILASLIVLMTGEVLLPSGKQSTQPLKSIEACTLT